MLKKLYFLSGREILSCVTCILDNSNPFPVVLNIGEIIGNRSEGRKRDFLHIPQVQVILQLLLFTLWQYLAPKRVKDKGSHCCRERI